MSARDSLRRFCSCRVICLLLPPLWLASAAGAEPPQNLYVPHAEAARQEMAAVAVGLFDTIRSSPEPLSAGTIQERAGWLTVPEDTTDHAFRGDAVIMNDRMAIVLRRGGPGAELYSHGAHGYALRAVLAPAAEPPGVKLASIATVENSPAEVVVDAAFQSAEGRRLSVRYELAMGQMFVKTEAHEGTVALSIAAPCRFMVLPDFFADDLVVDAQEIPVDTAELPSENFLLSMLPGGEAIVMSVASQRAQDARIALTARDGRRTIDRSEVFYGKDGKIWVAVIDGPGVWHEHGIAADDINKILPLDWQRPFPAQWRVDWRRADGLTDSWEMIAEKSDHGFEKYGWSGEPDTIPSDRKRWATVLGTFRYPCWLDESGRGYLQPLRKTIRFQGPAIIYPIRRVRSTPLKEFTVVDLVRATLGVGPCEYILDVEGQGSQYKGRATCATRDALAEIYGHNQQRQKRAEIEQILGEVVVFVKHIRGRIEDYVGFGHGVIEYLDHEQKAHPELAAVADELKTLSRQIDAHVESRREKTKTPQYVIDLTEKFRQTLLDYEGDDALSKCNVITHAIVEVGGNQDELVGECRMVTRALRQRAGLIVATDPRAAELAGEIRRRCQEVLRNPAVHEGARH